MATISLYRAEDLDFIHSQPSQGILILALVFSLPTLCLVTRLKSGPLALCLTPRGRLQAGRLSQDAGLSILPVAGGLGNGTW